MLLRLGHGKPEPAEDVGLLGLGPGEPEPAAKFALFGLEPGVSEPADGDMLLGFGPGVPEPAEVSRCSGSDRVGYSKATIGALHGLEGVRGSAAVNHCRSVPHNAAVA